MDLAAFEHDTIDKDRFQLMQACLASQVDKVPGHGTFYAGFGPPGIGKTWEQAAFAKFHNLFHRIVILGRIPSPDVAGFFVPDVAKGTVAHLINDTLIDPPYDKEKYDGVLITFDEISNTLFDQQASIQSFLNDWAMEGKPVGKNVFYSFAGNREEDGCGAGPISQALQDRLLIDMIDVDAPGWLKWAAQNDIDYRIMAFLSWKPQHLHAFNPAASLGGQPSPRGWEKASHMIKVSPDIDGLAASIVSKKIGPAIGIEFSGFIKMAGDLCSVGDVFIDPENAMLPNHNTSAVYAMCTSLAFEFGKRKTRGEDITKDEVDATITYLRRMQEGMAVFGFRMINNANPDFCRLSDEFAKFQMDYKHITV